MTYRNFSNLGELIKHITSALSERYRQPAGALVTAAVQTKGEPILAAAQCLLSDEVVTARAICEYEHVVLLESWLPFHLLLGTLSNLLGGGGQLAGYPLPGTYRGANSRSSVCGLHGHSGWSAEVVDISVQDAHSSTLLQDAVVRAGLPAYPTVAAAAEAWVFGRHLSKNRSAPDPGRFALLLPDTRARLIRAELEAATVTVAIEANMPWADLALHVASSSGHVIGNSDAMSCAATVRLDIPPETDELTLYLLDKPHDLLAQVDLSRISPLFGVLPERLLSVAVAKDELLAGENDSVEFKPYCDLASDKAAELLETVVAFANTRGGRMYIGVDRHGVPEGVAALRQHAVAHVRKSIPSAMLADYKARVRALVCDRISAVPHHSINELTIDGCPVLCLDVPQGDKAPYATHENDVFIRKGSTNRKPDPKTELPRIKVTGPAF